MGMVLIVLGFNLIYITELIIKDLVISGLRFLWN
jgi:hypothetical protein